MPLHSSAYVTAVNFPHDYLVSYLERADSGHITLPSEVAVLLSFASGLI